MGSAVLLKVGVLASHGGTNLQAIIDACEEGAIEAEVALVISNNSGSGALERAERHSIATAHLSGVTHPNHDALDQAISQTLVDHGVQLVVLAGYMKALGQQTLQTFHRRIINIHPALLPAFGGKGYFGGNVHRSVMESGVRFSGPTVHIVTGGYDEGPIVAQKVVPVLDDDTPDTLAARVLIEEHLLYAQVIQMFASDMISWRGDRVVICPQTQ